MHQRGQYGTRSMYGHSWAGAEPREPVRQVLFDSLKKLKRDRQALVAKIQENEVRLKVTLDQLANFEQPLVNEVRRLQFEALRHASSAAAADAVAAKQSLAHVDAQLLDLSARIAKAMPPPPPPRREPLAKQPSKSPRAEAPAREPPPRREPLTRAPLPSPPDSPREEDKWGSIKVGAYVAGAAVIGGLLIIAASRESRGSRARA